MLTLDCRLGDPAGHEPIDHRSGDRDNTTDGNAYHAYPSANGGHKRRLWRPDLAVCQFGEVLGRCGPTTPRTRLRACRQDTSRA